MRIGYTTAASVVASTEISGFTWLTSDGGVACVDGKPSRKARFQWASNPTPAIGDWGRIDLVFAAPTPINITALLGLSGVPVGAKVLARGQRPGDAVPIYNFGGTAEGSVVQFADGTRGCWFVHPFADELFTRVSFRIYNDVAGAIWATAATEIDIGELVAMPAVDLDHEPNWDMPLIDPSSGGRSRASQSYVSRRTPYRRLQAALTPEYVNKVRAGGLANGMDWTQLAYALTGQRRMAAIVRTDTTAEANATAIYGTAALSGERHAAGDYYSASITVEEEPAT